MHYNPPSLFHSALVSKETYLVCMLILVTVLVVVNAELPIEY
jgi:hypothetical protein